MISSIILNIKSRQHCTVIWANCGHSPAVCPKVSQHCPHSCVDSVARRASNLLHQDDVAQCDILPNRLELDAFILRLQARRGKVRPHNPNQPGCLHLSGANGFLTNNAIYIIRCAVGQVPSLHIYLSTSFIGHLAYANRRHAQCKAPTFRALIHWLRRVQNNTKCMQIEYTSTLGGTNGRCTQTQNPSIDRRQMPNAI